MILKKARDVRITYGKEVRELTSATMNTTDFNYQQLRKALAVVSEELNLKINDTYGTTGREDKHMEYDGWFRLEEDGEKFHLHLIMFQKPLGTRQNVGMDIDVRPENGVYESEEALYVVVGALDRALRPEAHKKIRSTLRN